ncbi:hypothetical protein niasHS_010163 [Heterodera schachtii]|uniref:Double-strand-break repair protein rad21 n=1 Tax=Heterodera schachtii TaxID=97005 RepID=A0ABD2IYX9_HETSC
MFYAQFVLSKKGPLAKIWLAAHWEKKLSKAQIYETNVQDAVEEIMKPKVKLSLRTTGHLLLGIVRIYSKKAHYVMTDCNEAFLKLKMAFKATGGSARDHDLREREPRESGGTSGIANSTNNDIPEVITDFYDNLPEIHDFDLGPIKDYQPNQSRIDDITLREDRFETSSRTGLDFVADAGAAGGLDDFGEREHLRRSRSRSIFEEMEDEVEQQRRGDIRASDGHSFEAARQSGGQPIGKDDDFGQKRADGSGLELFNNDFNDFGTAEDLDMLFNVDELNKDIEHGGQIGVAPTVQGVTDDGEQPMDVDGANDKMPTNELSFQLEPIEPLQRNHERVRQKRKRKLIIDEQKVISGDEMKANMADYSDTIQPLDLAPPTKQLMRLKENGQLEKLLTMPACMDWLLDPDIIRIYQAHLVPHAREADDLSLTDELREDLQLVEHIEEEPCVNTIASLEQQHVANSPLAENGGDNLPLLDGAQIEVGADPQTPLVDATAFSPPQMEKRQSARRSRAHEREEENEDEEVFTRRTKNVLQSIATKLRAANTNKIVFEDLFTKGSTRRTAAQKFYALLELKKWQAIEVEQRDAFDTIEISAGARMNETIKLAI